VCCSTSIRRDTRSKVPTGVLDSTTARKRMLDGYEPVGGTNWPGRLLRWGRCAEMSATVDVDPSAKRSSCPLGALPGLHRAHPPGPVGCPGAVRPTVPGGQQEGSGVVEALAAARWLRTTARAAAEASGLRGVQLPTLDELDGADLPEAAPQGDRPGPRVVPSVPGGASREPQGHRSAGTGHHRSLAGSPAAAQWTPWLS
jgi:hypothetical protein